jgi:hypothetical protein
MLISRFDSSARNEAENLLKRVQSPVVHVDVVPHVWNRDSLRFGRISIGVEDGECVGCHISPLCQTIALTVEVVLLSVQHLYRLGVGCGYVETSEGQRLTNSVGLTGFELLLENCRVVSRSKLWDTGFLLLGSKLG